LPDHRSLNPLTLRLLILALALAVSTAAPTADAPVIRGLDHIPLAVNDLDRSKADFEALGFVLKPGRPHANGLRNAHVKFLDGTEIELISAPASTDALASDYFNWLKNGEGPVFLGVYAPDRDALTRRLSSLGLALDWTSGLGIVSEPTALKRLFFARRQRSPTDRPEHFAHANTASSLSGVWLAGAVAEQGLLPMLGAVPIEEALCGPFGSSAAAFALPEGRIAFVEPSSQRSPGRSIVGVTVTVGSLDTVRSILSSNGIRYEQLADCKRASLWVGPTAAHGVWLEFHQPTASR
jgi:hypothetical protein